MQKQELAASCRLSEPVDQALGIRRWRLLGKAILLTSSFLASGSPAWAKPTGGTVVGGEATIHQAPGQTTIDQVSKRAIINWQEFSIGTKELTRFKQPGKEAIALNRVTGDDPSRILGRLEANGNVWLVNRNGVLIGPSARVDVHGLLATTADIQDQDFMAGGYDFSIPSPNPNADIVNQGRISIGEHGLGGLVAPHVRNDGVISGRLGTMVLAGTPTFTVDMHGDRMIQFTMTSEVVKNLEDQGALVENTGTITADGGRVLMTADAAAGVVDDAINMDGVVEARSVGAKNGAIVLDGGNDGIVRVAGSLDASGAEPNEKGGQVKVLGEKVGLLDKARVNALGNAGGGEILIGGNYKGQGPEVNAKQTHVETGATIAADATSAGDGGLVVLWSDKGTRFGGTISARGGPAGGNGGFIETSAATDLEALGLVDAGASAGEAGVWLIDPENVLITSTGTGDLVPPILFADPPANTQIHVGSINNADQNVVIQAIHDIIIDAPISISEENVGIVFQAGRNINVGESISTNNGVLHFEAHSPHANQNMDAREAVFGEIVFGDGVNIYTRNAPITLIFDDLRNLGAFSVRNQAPGALIIGPSQGGRPIAITGNIAPFFKVENFEVGQVTTAGSDGLGVDSRKILAGSIIIQQTIEFNNIILRSENSIKEENKAGIIANKLGLETRGDVILSGGNHVDVLAFSVGGEVDFGFSSRVPVFGDVGNIKGQTGGGTLKADFYQISFEMIFPLSGGSTFNPQKSAVAETLISSILMTPEADEVGSQIGPDNPRFEPSGPSIPTTPTVGDTGNDTAGNNQSLPATPSIPTTPTVGDTGNDTAGNNQSLPATIDDLILKNDSSSEKKNLEIGKGPKILLNLTDWHFFTESVAEDDQKGENLFNQIKNCLVNQYNDIVC